MRARLLYGVPLSVVVLALLWLDHRIRMAHCFSLLVLAAAILAWLEYGAMALPARRAWRAAGVPVVAALIGAAWYCLPNHIELFHMAAVPVIMFAFLITVALRWGAAQPTFQEAATWIVGILYAGYLPAYFLQLRSRPDGEALVLACLLIVKLGDTGAYFTGRTLGRRKLCKVSPNKTIEGALGGLLFSCTAAYACAHALFPAGTYGAGAVIAAGLVIGGVGQAGDLIESLLKRACGVKHSSIVFPEIGGVLDVVDSMMFAAPALLLLLTAAS
jgi:phosphatidate cytidylyltransferase